MREAQILADVRHESIVKLVAYGTDPRFGTWLAMEWIEGDDLMKELEKGPLPLVSALALARRVAGALAALHARGVLHRDVKPTNIMLPGGRVEEAKLLDLGLARIQAAPRTTQQGLTLGTPGYMAPEQARGARADRRARRRLLARLRALRVHLGHAGVLGRSLRSRCSRRSSCRTSRACRDVVTRRAP